MPCAIPSRRPAGPSMETTMVFPRRTCVSEYCESHRWGNTRSPTCWDCRSIKSGAAACSLGENMSCAVSMLIQPSAHAGVAMLINAHAIHAAIVRRIRLVIGILLGRPEGRHTYVPVFGRCAVRAGTGSKQGSRAQAEGLSRDQVGRHQSEVIGLRAAIERLVNSGKNRVQQR